VNELLIGLVGAVLATNQPAAVSNLVQQNTGITVTLANTNDAVQQELQKLMDADDASQAEVDKWIRDNNAFAANGAGESKANLNKRILERFAPVRKGYEDFLQRHPDSADGHLAFGSFLNDIGYEDEAAAQYEKATQLDPKNPAGWNNLANYHGHAGSVTNAFAEYAKAIELRPAEPVYYQNLATTVYLFRKDARQFYGLNEQQVFDKALALYGQACKLRPDDFVMSADLAISYYGIKPLRTNDALMAWTNAMKIAATDDEREGVDIHFARIKMSIGRYDEARGHLDAVTNSTFADIKQRLERNLAAREHPSTNAVDEVTNSIPTFTNAPALEK
jgi:tetratricopeptide (TPR) repeat protein